MLVQVYGDTAPTDKSCSEWDHVGNDFDISRMEISFVEDKPRSGQPKKFEEKELEASLEQDQNQTQEEFAESLGITQQAFLYD